MITVKNVKATDQDLAIAAIVQAFSPDPAARWMYPDSQQYLNTFPASSKPLPALPSSMEARISWRAIQPRRFGCLRAFIRTKEP